MKKTKIARIWDEDWERLMKLKLKTRVRNLGELIHIILIHTDEAIKKGDFILFKKDDKPKEMKIAIEEAINENEQEQEINV